MTEFSRLVARNPENYSRADRVIAFIEEYLHIPEGMHVGKPVVLREWQKDIIRQIYDGYTRTAIISFARKNAKTALSAMLLLVHLAGPEARTNSDIYSTARSRDQAGIVFRLAAKMVRMSKRLGNIIIIRDSAKQLYCGLTGVTYKALSAEATTAHGLSPVFAIHDELGQVVGPRDDLYDTVETGAGAHDDPLSIIISTQAPNDGDLLSTLIDDGIKENSPAIKVFLFTADADDDIYDPATWYKANPALGDFRSYKDFEANAAKAKRLPSFEAKFKNLYLNQRISASAHLIPPSVWALGNGPTLEDLLDDGVEVFGGLDLSSRRDLTALVLIAKDHDDNVHIFPYFWAPSVGAADRAERDKVPYDLWADEGYLELTPGNSVDYSYVAEKIAEIEDRCNLVQINYDRWRINDLKRELERIGCEATITEFGQGYKDMSPAIEEFEVLALNGKLRHGEHPILKMCVQNATPLQDPAGNRKLDKSKPTKRIDGIVATVMAVAAMMRQEQSPQVSGYELLARQQAAARANA